MKKTVAVLLVLGCAGDRSGKEGLPSRVEGVLDADAPIVARVGDGFVTRAELRRALTGDPILDMLESWREKLKRDGKWNQAREEEYSRKVEVRKQAVARDVVMMHLLAHEAVKRGILPSDPDIERRLRRALKKLGDPKKHGYTVDELRAQIRRKVLEEELVRRERVGAVSPSSPARMRSFYEEHREEILRPDSVKLRVICIARKKEDPILGPVEVPVARQKAEKIAAEVSLDPNKFAAFARNHSDEAETAERGGLLVCSDFMRSAPWGRPDLIPRKVLPPWLGEAVVKIDPGQTSSVVEGPDAFYILKLDAEIPAEKLSFADAQDMIESILRRQDAARARKVWLRKMASQAVVVDGRGGLIELESLFGQAGE